jgi:prolyl-tRNA synthetase
MVGGLIMGHGDDAGLVVPPAVAPAQVVVLPVRADASLLHVAEQVAESLRGAGVRVRVDAREGRSFGRRVTEWEIKGAPLRVELGPRDLAAGQVTLVRRDTGEKTAVALAGLAAAVPGLLATVQSAMLAAATRRRDDRTHDVGSVAEAAEAARTGFARLPWAGVGAAGEDRLAQDAVTVRCLQREDGSLPEDPDEPDLVAVVARSY